MSDPTIKITLPDGTVVNEAQGITQEDFAKAIGISRQTVIAIERGNYIPSLLLGLKIAKFFNKRVEEVFTYHEK